MNFESQRPSRDTTKENSQEEALNRLRDYSRENVPNDPELVQLLDALTSGGEDTTAEVAGRLEALGYEDVVVADGKIGFQGHETLPNGYFEYKLPTGEGSDVTMTGEPEEGELYWEDDFRGEGSY